MQIREPKIDLWDSWYIVVFFGLVLRLDDAGQSRLHHQEQPENFRLHHLTTK